MWHYHFFFFPILNYAYILNFMNFDPVLGMEWKINYVIYQYSNIV